MRQIHEVQPILSAIFRSVVDRHEFEDRDSLKQLMAQPRLVVAVNHSTPISWVPAICLLAEKFCEAGGGNRTPRGIFDRLFYAIPGLKQIAEYFTQSDRPLTFDEVLNRFVESDKSDIVVFPEGAMTFFGDLKKIQPFRSPRFVEIAIRAEAPILVAVHRGTEEWNTLFPIPKEIAPYISLVSSLFTRRIADEKFLNLPLNLRKIDHFSMITKLYTPVLKTSELSNDPTECRAQVESEAERIRTVMQELFDELGSKQAKTVS